MQRSQSTFYIGLQRRQQLGSKELSLLSITTESDSEQERKQKVSTQLRHIRCVFQASFVTQIFRPLEMKPTEYVRQELGRIDVCNAAKVTGRPGEVKLL